jgi:hypothetical protein
MRILGRSVVGALCVLVGCLSLGGASAVAFNGRLGIGSFSAPSGPTGVAVDQETGNVYVVENQTGVVAAFDGEGGPPFGVPAVTSGTLSPAFGPVGLAIDNACWYHQPRLNGTACEAFDPSNGDLYVADPEGNAIKKLALNKLTKEYEVVHAFAFKEPNGVAVDHEGNVYVADYYEQLITVFDPAGSEVGKIPTRAANNPMLVAVGTFGTVYVSGIQGETVELAVDAEYKVQSERVLQVTSSTKAVAVDALGNALVDDGSSVVEYSPSGMTIGRFGESEPGAVAGSYGLAVNMTTGEAYASLEQAGAVNVYGATFKFPEPVTGPSSELRQTAATLNGTVNPEGLPVTSCFFEYGASTSYEHTMPCEPEPGSGETPVPVSAKITGLQPNASYHYRVVATNEHGTNSGADGQFFTPGPAGIHDDSVSDVTSTSATLNADIELHGVATTYYFQYGPSTAYGTNVPAPPGATLGSGTSQIKVTRHLQGLSAGITYHYRVVVVSQLETSPGSFETHETDGQDQTFTTQVAGGGLVLPDGRSWELVTPPDKHGGQVFAIGQYSDEGAVIQAAAGGGAMTWVADDPTEAQPRGYTNLLQGFSSRGPGGWVSRDIAIPHPGPTGIYVGLGQEYRFFSEDLSQGVVQPFGFGQFAPSLSAEASESTAYLSTEYVNGDASDSCSVSCFRPLVTGAPGFANVPAGTVFGNTRGCWGCQPQFVGATPDLGHVVLTSSVALTSTPDPQGGLYEWSAGKLVLVSVLPGPGGEATGGGLGTGGTAGANARHAISDDGSRIFWTHQETGDLFMRDVARGETLLIGKNFEDASSDGSIVFFGGKMCKVTQNATTGQLECSTTDLGGKVVGTSGDGSSVYFVSPEAFAPGGVPGSNNLYVRHAGVTRFIAAVSQEDVEPVTEGDLTHLTLRVSPNGRWLAFMSQLELAGASTRDAVTGLPDEEVFLYDADGNGGAGRLVCASCNPSGARPVGMEYPGEDTLWGGDRIWGHTQIASNIPGWTPYAEGQALYQSRALSDSGRLFFNSNDGLVPQDVNGTWDVYQYEPAGVGDCTKEKMTFSDRSNGCVGLVSSGGSGEESGFLDASATGSDVFFLTSAKLAGQDFDSALDVYDAHECSSSAPCFAPPPVQPPVCDTGDACKASPTPQPALFGSPSSATFSGAGNVTSIGAKPSVAPKGLSRAQKLARALRACRKKRGKRRASCVRQAKARYAAKTRGVNASKRGRG